MPKPGPSRLLASYSGQTSAERVKNKKQKKNNQKPRNESIEQAWDRPAQLREAQSLPGDRHRLREGPQVPGRGACSPGPSRPVPCGVGASYTELWPSLRSLVPLSLKAG